MRLFIFLFLFATNLWAVDPPGLPISSMPQVSTVVSNGFVPLIQPYPGRTTNDNFRISARKLFDSGYSKDMPGGSMFTTNFAGTNVTAVKVTANVPNVRNVKASPYNAKADGVTDDADAIQAALNDAYATSDTVAFPPGRYLIKHRLHNKGGVSMVGMGSGATIVKNFDNGNYGGWLCLGPWLLKTPIAGGFDNWPAPANWIRISSTTISAGATSFDVADASSLAAGDIINLRAGYFVLDTNLPDFWGRFRIKTVAANTITIDGFFPFDVNIPDPQPGGGNPEQPHYIFKERANVLTGYVIENLAFENSDAFGDYGHSIFCNDYGVAFRNISISGYNTGITFWGGENCTLDNIQFFNVQMNPGAPYFGFAANFLVWGARNILIENIVSVRGLNLLYREGRCENLTLRNIKSIGFSQRPVGDPILLSEGGLGQATVEKWDIDADRAILLSDGDQDFVIRDLDINFSTGPSVGALPLGQIQGHLKVKAPSSFDLDVTDSNLRTENFSYKILPSQASAKIVYFPVHGWIKRVKVYFNSITGITSAYFAPPVDNVAENIDFTASLAAGTWTEIKQTVSALPQAGWLLETDSRWFMNCRFIEPVRFCYTSDGTVPGGTYINIAVEYYDRANEGQTRVSDMHVNQPSPPGTPFSVKADDATMTGLQIWETADGIQLPVFFDAAHNLNFQYGSSPAPNLTLNNSDYSITLGAAYLRLAGASGPIYLVSAGAPVAAFPDGSVKVRTDGAADSSLYVRVGGSWLPFNQTGPTGATGPAGPAGPAGPSSITYWAHDFHEDVGADLYTITGTLTTVTLGTVPMQTEVLAPGTYMIWGCFDYTSGTDSPGCTIELYNTETSTRLGDSYRSTFFAGRRSMTAIGVGTITTSGRFTVQGCSALGLSNYGTIDSQGASMHWIKLN